MSTRSPKEAAEDLAKVREFIVENFLFGDAGRLNDTTSFLHSGILDSTGILKLVAFLEETFGVAVQDDELVPENLDTLRNIERFLGRKRK
jgi:acyl carrier protein